MELLTFIGVIVAFFYIAGLRGRVKDLERSLGQTKKVELKNEINRDDNQEVENTGYYQNNQPQYNPVVNDVVETQQNREPDALDRLTAWAKDDWMLKLGALLLIIGFGWLASYAFLNNWIGPVGRITLGIILGIALISLGYWRIQKFLHQGGVFLVTGSTVILMTVFAARSIYDFFTPISALALMFLSTVFVAVAALKYNNRALALASIILAGIAPLLTSSNLKDETELFTYLAVVTVGTLWMVFITGRRELTIAALAIVSMYSLSYLNSGNKEVLMFMSAFGVIFFLANMFSIIKMKGEDIQSDVAVAAGNSFMIIVWVLAAVGDEWKSMVLVGWMLFFILGAFLVFKFTSKKDPFYVYAGVSMLLLVIATAVEFDGLALFFAYLLEAVFVTAGSYFLTNSFKFSLPFSISFLIPIILSFEIIDKFRRSSELLNENFFAILILGLSLIALGMFFRAGNENDGDTEMGSASMLVVGSIYLYALLWMSMHILFTGSTAVISSLIVYTLIGIFFYFYGMNKRMSTLSAYGGIMVGLVIVRLFLVDVWRMDLSGRIVVFFLVGILLISTAFIKRKKDEGSNQIEGNQSNNY